MFSASCAMYPGYSHRQSILTMVAELDAGEFVEPGLGALSLSHIQLVPQNKGQITEELIDELSLLSPTSKFRLHANAPVMERHVFVDLNELDKQWDYFAHIKTINQALGNPDYSLHSGRRTCSLRSLFDKAQRLQDFLGARVAIEGQYKTARAGVFLVNSWSEYESLLKSQCFFALDLSHLNIVRFHEGPQDDLVLAMLKDPKCIEVHLSNNDGTGDHHQVVSEDCWWSAMLSSISPEAVIFSEGNRRCAMVSKTNNQGD